MSAREAACLLAGLIVGSAVTYLGILLNDYRRAFGRTHRRQQ